MGSGDAETPLSADADAITRLHQALSELAGCDARALLDEARAQAHSDVRDLLGQALRESMLRVIETELHGRAPAPAPASVAPQHGSRAVYVYGVVDGALGTGTLPAGVDGVGPVRGVTESGLTALISDVDAADFHERALQERMADMSWVQDTARRHEQVIEAVDAPATVIPMRMGTVYPAETDVRERLRREVRALREALRYLQARSEWGVKICDRRPARVGPDRRHEPHAGGAGLHAERHRLRAERAQRADAARRAEDAAAHVHDVLCTVATDSLIVPPHGLEGRERRGELLLNGVYLVSDAAREDFCIQARGLERSLAGLGLELELTGPWPAYNFVPGAIAAGW